jgi:hypothetical protein
MYPWFPRTLVLLVLMGTLQCPRIIVVFPIIVTFKMVTLVMVVSPKIVRTLQCLRIIVVFPIIVRTLRCLRIIVVI